MEDIGEDKLTEMAIIKKLSHWTDDRKFPWQLAMSFIYKWECDFWTMTNSGETREFEIKISRSDFLADAKKEKHKSTEGANFFYYVCPVNLIKKEEIDSRYGLIYVGRQYEGGEPIVTVVKKPRRLHNNEFDRWKILANKMYWKFRELWRSKYIDKEISIKEYWEGFNIQLEEFEQST